ncbi:hypothetical protein [Lutimonas sp.]|uniref:hypothetical protein n=1 Tax=Lutimonas sp. TaxID=1872403 RepID=UPI003C73968A
MKSILIFTILVFAAVPSCNDEEELIGEDILQDIGIIGKWKLDSRAVDGISNLAVQCCDYIEFEQDKQTDSLSGNFKAYGYLFQTNGIFTLNLNEESILFQYDNTQKVYTYTLEENILAFRYTENGQEISETWRKELP